MRLLRITSCSVWVGSWKCSAKIWYIEITEASFRTLPFNNIKVSEGRESSKGSLISESVKQKVMKPLV